MRSAKIDYASRRDWELATLPDRFGLRLSQFGHDRRTRGGGQALPEMVSETNGESDDRQRWIRVAHRREH